MGSAAAAMGAGCGVNLSNSEPTDCINDVIARHNARTGAALALVRKEVRHRQTHQTPIVSHERG